MFRHFTELTSVAPAEQRHSSDFNMQWVNPVTPSKQDRISLFLGRRGVGPGLRDGYKALQGRTRGSKAPAVATALLQLVGDFLLRELGGQQGGLEQHLLSQALWQGLPHYKPSFVSMMMASRKHRVSGGSKRITGEDQSSPLVASPAAFGALARPRGGSECLRRRNMIEIL